MSQSLPAGGFRWISIEPNEIAEPAKWTDKGYLLEIDVCYPEESHDLHNDLPFMCERIEINHVEKLVPNLMISKITLSTFEHWIKLSHADCVQSGLIERLNSISLHG